MEKKNNGIVIILMGVIIVILAVLCILFATNTITFKQLSYATSFQYSFEFVLSASNS